MADVEITVSDNISTGIETKLKGISNAALDASSSVSKLKAAMQGGFGSAAQLEQASVSAKEFSAALAAAGGDISKVTPELLGLGNAATTAATDLRGLTAAQVALFKAQQEGAAFAKDLNASFGLDRQITSAREAASAFQELGLTEIEAANGLRGYTEAQVAALRAQQEGATFTAELNARLIETNLSYKSASESASVFAAAEKEAAAATQSASAGFVSLVKVLGSLIAIQEIIKGTDAYVKLDNALRLAGLQGKELASVQQQMFETADRNGVAVETLANLYQKLAVSQAILGSSSKQTTELVKGISAALREQGATTAQAQRATTDLAEIFDLNTVSMRQWRGVIIQVPSIAIAAANGISRFHGSVSALTEAILHQQVSSKELFDGLLIGLKNTQTVADGMTLTISASFNVLHNKIAEFISDVNSNVAVVRLLSGAIILVADNLNILIPLILGFGLAWSAVKIAAIISDLKTLAVGFIQFLPALAAGIVAGAEFALGFAAAAAACLGLAEVLAFLTGNGDRFNQWLQATSNQVVNFAAGLLGVGVKANDAFKGLASGASAGAQAISDVTTKTKDLGTQMTQTATTSTSAASAINASFQRIGNTIDNLIWKMNNGAQAATDLYNALAAVGGSSGSFQTAGVTNTGDNSSIQTIGGPTKKFATGGSFFVGGSEGVDTNKVTFRATKGERVDILTPAQQRAQANALKGSGVWAAPRGPVTVNIVTPNVDSFFRSRRQVSEEIASMVGA